MESSRHILLLLVLMCSYIFCTLAKTKCTVDEDDDRTPYRIQHCKCTKKALGHGCRPLKRLHKVKYDEEKMVINVFMGCNCDKKPQGLVTINAEIDQDNQRSSTPGAEVSSSAGNVECIVDSEQTRETFERCQCSEIAVQQGCQTSTALIQVKYI